MRTLVLSFLAVLALMGQARAQTPGDPAACAALADDLERLACYDALFRPLPEAGSDTALVIESKQSIPARPAGRKPATIEVSCEAGGVAVRFGFAGQLLSEVGEEAAITFLQQTGNLVRNLPVSADNTTIGFPPGAQSDAFLASLEGSGSILVRITPPRQRTVQVEFDLAPHMEAIARIRELCR